MRDLIGQMCMSKLPVRSASGEVIGVLGFAEDVTDRVRQTLDERCERRRRNRFVPSLVDRGRPAEARGRLPAIKRSLTPAFCSPRTGRGIHLDPARRGT